MACTARGARDLQAKAKKQLQNAKSPMEKLRAQCLLRGPGGIKHLGR